MIDPGRCQGCDIHPGGETQKPIDKEEVKKSPYPSADEAKKKKEEQVLVEVAKWELSIADAISRWTEKIDVYSDDEISISIPPFIPKDTIIKNAKELQSRKYAVRVSDPGGNCDVYLPEIGQHSLWDRFMESVVQRTRGLRLHIQVQKPKEEEAPPTNKETDPRTVCSAVVNFFLTCHLLLFIAIMIGAAAFPQVFYVLVFTGLLAFRYIETPHGKKKCRCPDHQK